MNISPEMRLLSRSIIDHWVKSMPPEYIHDFLTEADLESDVDQNDVLDAIAESHSITTWFPDIIDSDSNYIYMEEDI